MPLYLDKTGYILPADRDYGTEKEVERIMADVPLLTAAGAPIVGTGAGKVVLLHKVVEQVRGSFVNRVQRIGDCVSFGTAGALEASYACDIAFRNESEQWADVATEWIYGTSRVLVGKGRLGNGDGSVGAWAARAVLHHGNLFRQRYGEHDLSTYSGQRAKSWGHRGLPLKLEETADQYPVPSMPPACRNYSELRDAIANGYGVSVCSNYGFRDTRDAEGFSRKSGSWAHCMHFHGVDDTPKRPGALCQNSWPPTWISGPKRHDQPDGSFWVDAETIDGMLQQNDSYIMPGLNGIQRTHIWDI